MKTWLIQQRAALALAFKRLTGSPGNTTLAAITIGIALALPVGGQLILANLQQLGQSNSSTPQISVFMSLSADSKTVSDLEAKLRAHAGIREVKTISKDDTRKRMRGAEGLAEIIDALPSNPFPDTFVITPKNDAPEAMEQLRDEFRKFQKVEHVQLDSAWARRLSVLMKLARTSVWLLAALFGVGLIALLFNTIRLQILTQRAEIEVSRLLGATDGFIGRPFYYFGAMQSLLGGMLALGIVSTVSLLLRTPVAELASLYSLQFTLYTLSVSDCLLVLLIAGALGWAGASLSVRRHLREM